MLDLGTSSFNISDVHALRKISHLFLQESIPRLERVLAALQAFEHSYYSISSPKQQKNIACVRLPRAWGGLSGVPSFQIREVVFIGPIGKEGRMGVAEGHRGRAGTGDCGCWWSDRGGMWDG